MNQLLIALRHYTTGYHFVVLGDFMGVHESRLVRKTSEKIVTMALTNIAFPNIAFQIPS